MELEWQDDLTSGLRITTGGKNVTKERRGPLWGLSGRIPPRSCHRTPSPGTRAAHSRRERLESSRHCCAAACADWHTRSDFQS